MQVHVEESHAASGGSQRGRQIDRHRALADASFSGQHKHLVPDEHHPYLKLVLPWLEVVVHLAAAVAGARVARSTFRHRAHLPP